MKEYRCVKQLIVEQYDSWNCWMPGERITVEPGAVLWVSDRKAQIAIGEAVCLAAADGLWLEVPPQTLREHFKEIPSRGGNQNGTRQDLEQKMAQYAEAGSCGGMG